MGERKHTGISVFIAACTVFLPSLVLPCVSARAAASAWEDHRGEFILIALFFILQALLIVFLLMNIRMRRRVERELRESEVNYRTVADFTYDWEYWIDRDGRLRYISPSCERVTGYTRDELLSDPDLLTGIIVPEDKGIWEKHRHGDLQESDHCSIEFRIERKDGVIRWIEHTCVPVRGGEGAFLGYRACNRDITGRKTAEEGLALYRGHLERLVRDRTKELEDEVARRKEKEEELEIYHRDLERLVRERTKELEDEVARRKRAQEALAMREADLKRAQDVAVIGGWNLDLSTNHLSWTEGVYEIFGIPRGIRLDYQMFLSAVHPDDVEYVNRCWNDALKGAGYDIEHRIVADGAVKWVREKAQVEFSEDGVALRGSGIVQDITLRKQAEEEQHKLRQQLAHVSRVTTLGELATALAHEINQPLAAILANAQAALHMIDSQDLDLRELRAILDDIISDDKRAREVIRRVRSLLRKGSSKPGRMGLNQVVQDAVRLVEREIRARNISLSTELAGGLPPASGDWIQVGQVVINLLLNAIDAVDEVADAPRSITVESRKGGSGEVIVSVRDTGKGIREESMHLIFDPFYTTKDNGLGLGLSISRSIIEAHGGRLYAAPNAGRGATFSFSLPAMEGEVRDEPDA